MTDNLPIPVQQNVNLFLLDRSGSMLAIRDNVLTMFNAYVDELKSVPDLEFTLITFDSTSTDTIHQRAPIKDVPPLRHGDFIPRHGTPLFEAVTKLILKARDTYKPTDRVAIIILTDGKENSSSPTYTGAMVAQQVKEVTAWGWQVIFLGAGFDVYEDGRTMGVNAGQTMSYNAQDRRSSLRASGVVGQSMHDYYESGMTQSFSAEAKASVGDAYAGAAKHSTRDAENAAASQAIVDQFGTYGTGALQPEPDPVAPNSPIIPDSSPPEPSSPEIPDTCPAPDPMPETIDPIQL